MTRRLHAGLFALPLALAGVARAQTFDAGSSGADGALTFPANAGTILFDPTTSDPRLDADLDNVYHFTTITIPAGTTVRLSARTLPEGVPVVWLASGAVTIDGVLDLSGDHGHGYNAPFVPSVPGAGGYSGGVALLNGVAASTRGNGPGGGGGGFGHGGAAGHRAAGQAGGGDTAQPGTAYGNDFLLPLVGGSGGGGGNNQNGSGGGAGGGALLLASSTSIRLQGQVLANGGSGGNRAGGGDYLGGGGSGGAVRLVAPALTGAGHVQALGGSGITQASYGRVRLEAFRNTSTISVSPPQAAVTPAAPGTLFLPPAAPAIRVVRVAGQAVAASPTGSFVVPDVAIDAPAAVTVEVEAHHVPLGTVLSLTFQPETGAPFSATSTPLTGTLEASTATAQALFPHGPTRVFVRATWTP